MSCTHYLLSTTPLSIGLAFSHRVGGASGISDPMQRQCCSQPQRSCLLCPYLLGVYLLVPLLVSLTLHPTTTKATGPGLTTITTPPVSLTTPPPPALPPSSSPPHHQATPPPASPLHHQATAPPPLNHPAPQPCSVPPAPAALVGATCMTSDHSWQASCSWVEVKCREI